MKKLLLIVFSLSIIYSFSQNVDITLVKFIDHKYGPNWSTCNDSDMFYNSDTVVFTTKSNVWCKSLNFSICSNKIGKIYDSWICVEPTRRSGDIKGQIRTGKIKRYRSDYYIHFYKGRTHWRKYKIIELSQRSTGNLPSDEYLFMRLVKCN